MGLAAACESLAHLVRQRVRCSVSFGYGAGLEGGDTLSLEDLWSCGDVRRPGVSGSLPARWEAHRPGVAAWHAWLLTSLEDGSTHVLTEEVQHGWLSRLGKLFTPGRMQAQHQLWLEGLRLQALTGAPPPAAA